MIGFLLLLIALGVVGAGIEAGRKRNEKKLEDAIANSAIREHIRIKQVHPGTNYAEMTNDEFRVCYRDAAYATLHRWLFNIRAFGLGGATSFFVGFGVIVLGALTDHRLWFVVGLVILALGFAGLMYKVYCETRVSKMRSKIEKGDFKPFGS